ncbi:ABC transporter permease [Nonomuraea sp. GTA35]|uniref:ABC transporter permease n=1 Tax=Nonomuraea sp. GTA35 TaxID=1676746 RepID=UPI0035C06590
MHLRAVLEYRTDAILLAAAAVLTQLAGLIFLLTVFSHLPVLAGWKQWEVVCVYAMVISAEGVCSLLFEGTWHLASMINGGELDYLLVRPMPVVLQVMSSAVGMNGLGNLTMGVVLLTAGLAHVDTNWTVLTVIWALILFLSAILVRLGINLAAGAASFWLLSPSSALAYATQALGDLARYPISVYGPDLRIVLTIVPVAFVGFFPAAHLFDRGPHGWLGALTPVVAMACLLIGGLTFRAGVRRYESTGH